MPQHKVEDIRNIALCGHGSAGKTTLADQFLVKAGVVTHPVSVDDGTSVCDFDDVEKQRKHSIESSLVHFQRGDTFFQVIDTPGYPDFIGQTIGALRGVDTAAIVISARAGIEVNTRRVFQEAGKAGLGRVIVISKMDTDNIEFEKLLGSIREMFGNQCALLNVPIGCGADFKGVINLLDPPADTRGALLDTGPLGESLIESIIENDEEVVARYFEGQPPSRQELSRLIVDAVAEGNLIPIVCVSGKTGAGMSELLDALTLCGLPPGRINRTARNKDSTEVEVTADASDLLVAQVFKTRIDPFVQKLSYFRIFSGTIKKDQTIEASSSRRGIKIQQLLRVQGGTTEPVAEGRAGEILAVAKTEDLHTNSTLGELQMSPIDFPRPMVGLAISPKSRGDEAKLSGAVQKIVEEDPTVRLDRDPQTKELVMTGMSELHLLIVQEKLKSRDKVEVLTKEPKIPYRETIQTSAEGSYRHKKQTGGRGQFGEVHIRVFPLPEGTNIEEFATKSRFPSMRDYHYSPEDNFLWVDSIVGGTIPNNFLPAVEKGLRERMDRGVIAGYKVQNLCVEVHFGKHHPVDSSEAAFKTAGSMALRNVFQQAKPSLLEPIVNLHVTVPADKLGDVNSDMSGRRGRVLGMESAGGDLQTVSAVVPLAEVMNYARSLSSMTGGQGSFTMEFSHYDLVPGNVQKEIVEKAVLAEEEED